MLQIAHLKIYSCSVGVQFVSVYNFTRFRNRKSNSRPFWCLIVFYRTRTPQKVSPACTPLFHKCKKLCWFQTSLPLAAMPRDHCLLFQSYSSQRQRRFGFITERHRSRVEWNSTVCDLHGGQSGKVIDLLAWRCLPLGHPSAASGVCAVEQISSSKRQAAS